MSTHFDNFIGIDWSGAKGERLPGLAVAAMLRGGVPVVLDPPGGDRHWSRADIGAFLVERALDDGRTLVGIDSSFSMPFADREAYIPDGTWVRNAMDLWDDVERTCSVDNFFYGWSWVQRFHKHYHLSGGKGEHYERRMRVAERLCVESGAGPCESVFHLIGPSQVGLSGLSTIRVLQLLRDHPDIAVWPFQDISKARLVIVEIYAAMFAGMGGGKGKIRNALELKSILTNLGAGDGFEPGGFDEHKADAMVTAAALAAIAEDSEYWNPPSLSPMVRETEGWIFGLNA